MNADLIGLVCATAEDGSGAIDVDELDNAFKLLGVKLDVLEEIHLGAWANGCMDVWVHGNLGTHGASQWLEASGSICMS